MGYDRRPRVGRGRASSTSAASTTGGLEHCTSRAMPVLLLMEKGLANSPWAIEVSGPRLASIPVLRLWKRHSIVPSVCRLAVRPEISASIEFGIPVMGRTFVVVLSKTTVTGNCEEAAKLCQMGLSITINTPRLFISHDS